VDSGREQTGISLGRWSREDGVEREMGDSPGGWSPLSTLWTLQGPARAWDGLSIAELGVGQRVWRVAEPVALEAPDVADRAGRAPLPRPLATQQPLFPANGVVIASHTGGSDAKRNVLEGG
jgi:hypothetical protein